MNDPDSLRKITVIPAYRDTPNLLDVVSKFTDNMVHEICLVVDCATTDDKADIEKAKAKVRFPMHVIWNDKRKGIGYAIRMGITYALDNKYDVVVIMAGNNKDDPGEIPRLLNPILKYNYDYVQGSRFLPGGKLVKNPFLRGVFSRLLPFVWTLLTRVRCTDVTNGFRAYRLKILSDKRINIGQNWLDGYQLEYYVHYKVLTLGYKFTEVPVSKTYPFRHKGGYSKISPLRDWWGIIGPLVYLKLGIRE